jgi:HAD domain in Swiss Army Knife RNA repair proteins
MLILLDIDGVMLSASSWRPVEKLNDGFSSFNPRAVSNLQRIIFETNASIVLTSSHKSSYSLEQWQQIFLTRGIITSKIYKIDDNLNFLNRKDEILNWLNKNKNTRDYVIIDDDKSLNGLPTAVKNKLVLTSSMIGLTSDEASEAIKILKSAELATA